MRKFIGILVIWIVALAFITETRADIIVTGDSNMGHNNSSGVLQFYDNVFGSLDVYTNVNHWSVNNWSVEADNYSNSWVLGTDVTAASLAGKDWFVTSGQHSFSATETSVIASYLAGGGNMFLVGEGPAYSTINTNTNALLTGLGSGMSIGGSAASTNWFADDINATDPYTLGVTNFDGNYASSVVNGGVNLIGYQGNTIIAYESSTSTPVPEPATVALLGIGLAGLGGAEVRRRRKKKAVDKS